MVFVVVVADKGHGWAVVDEPGGVDTGRFVIIGVQCQTFVGFS